MKQLIHGVLLATLVAVPTWAASKGDVLVILSSEDKITLKDGVSHPTGFFLIELMTPLKTLVDAGYTPVFANPKGSLPVMDMVSDDAKWFSPKGKYRYQEARGLCEKLGLCGKPGTNTGTQKLNKLSVVRTEGLDKYAAVFFPGGHAPMEDLWKDKDVKEILKYFHDNKKPTALICHAPIAILSTLEDPEGYAKALTADDRSKMVEKSKDWIYRDYKLAVFTTREEQQEEPGQDNALGGFVKFYPDAALERAGATVTRAAKWESNAVRDKELITGQNPMSDQALSKLLLAALNEKSKGTSVTEKERTRTSKGK